MSRSRFLTTNTNTTKCAACNATAVALETGKAGVVWRRGNVCKRREGHDTAARHGSGSLAAGKQHQQQQQASSSHASKPPRCSRARLPAPPPPSSTTTTTHPTKHPPIPLSVPRKWSCPTRPSPLRHRGTPEGRASDRCVTSPDSAARLLKRAACAASVIIVPVRLLRH